LFIFDNEAEIGNGSFGFSFTKAIKSNTPINPGIAAK